MSLTQTITYDTAGNFTYDSSLIEISSAVARLKDVRPTDATFYSSYSSSIDANWGSGTLTGTATNGAAVVSGYLDLTAATVKYVSYNAASNAAFQQTGCLRLKVTPNYSGSPASNQCFFTITNAANDYKNLISITHVSSGQLNANIVNSAGVDIVNSNLGAWSPTSGTEYELELNFDITVGATRVFVDGTQLGSTVATTGTRSSSIAVMKVGTNFDASLSANFKVRQFTLYSTVQHTANYTPAAAPSSTIYSTNNPSIVVNSGVLMDGLDGFTQTATIAGSDQIKYQLMVDSVAKYYNGSAWATSDGTYTQSNTAAEVETNKATLNLSSGSTVKVKALLHSDDGSTRPSLSTVALSYNFFVSEPTAPTECIVYNWLKTLTGDDIPTPTLAKLSIENKYGFFYGNHMIAPFVTTVNYNSDGYAEISLVETSSVSKYYNFTIQYLDDDGVKRKINLLDRIVPNTTTASLSALTSA